MDNLSSSKSAPLANKKVDGNNLDSVLVAEALRRKVVNRSKRCPKLSKADVRAMAAKLNIPAGDATWIHPLEVARQALAWAEHAKVKKSVKKHVSRSTPGKKGGEDKDAAAVSDLAGAFAGMTTEQE